MTRDEIDSASSAIEDADDVEREEITIDETTLPQTIREICEAQFQKNPLKMAKLSPENAKGMKTASVTNNFLESHYGFRLTALDDMIFEGMNRNMSIDATGQMFFNEALKSINASFQNAPEPKLIKRLI